MDPVGIVSNESGAGVAPLANEPGGGKMTMTMTMTASTGRFLG
jgi:hypothetical protein